MEIGNTYIILCDYDLDYAKRLEFDELLPYSVYTEIRRIKEDTNTKFNIELSKFSTYPELLNLAHVYSYNNAKNALSEIVDNHFKLGLYCSSDGRSILSDAIDNLDYDTI